MNRFHILYVPLLVFALSIFTFAKGQPERTQFSRDIRVEVGESAGDVTCINCSIYVRGKVDGDATAIHGSIVVEQGGAIGGDVTAVWGDIRADNGASISGDSTAVAGALRTQPQANLRGDRTSLEGTQWVLAIVLPPIILIGLIIALIIWLVQRFSRPEPLPAGQGSVG